MPTAMKCPACGATLGTMPKCPSCGRAVLLPEAKPVDAHKRTVSLSPYSMRPGAVVDGRYKVEELLGAGGMGEVYKARDTSLNRWVCLKTLRPELLRDRTSAERFKREAQSMARVAHPGVVPVLDVGSDGDVRFLVMEFAEGRPLSGILREEGPLDPARACRISAQVLDALDAAHAAKLVHRDVKPANVMVHGTGADERARVIDFGVAKLLDDGQPPLTTSNMVCGTPHYMSPELAMGQPLDGRADVYAVGVVLFELVTGVLPFDDRSPVRIMERQVNERPPRPSDAAGRRIPDEVERLVLQAMEKEVERRPGAAQLRDALRAAAERLDANLAAPTRPTVDRVPARPQVIVTPPPNTVGLPSVTRPGWTRWLPAALLAIVLIALVARRFLAAP